MATHKTQFNFRFAELSIPSPMDWELDDGEQKAKILSSPSCSPSPGQYPHSQLAVSQMTFTGEHIGPLFANLHHERSFHQSYPGQVSPFPQNLENHEFMPWHYQMSEALHPAQQPQSPQFDHEMPAAYNQPLSPVSDVVKPDEDYFHHVHHSTPIFLPPTSFMLSTSPVLYNQLPSPGSSQSSIKQEEGECTARASEGFMLPVPTVPEPTEPTETPQEMAIDNEGHESDHQDLEHDDSNKKPLAIPLISNKDDKTAPYAVLIYRALMSTPRRRMVLANIYKYFREKIPRFRKMKGRGWMNSIRHNLSMNGAFLKVDRPLDDPGKGFIWVLSNEAIIDGVKSTTRYRKSPPHSKKRAMDDAFSRSSTTKRRRKSTRKLKRTAAKSGSYAQEKAITTIKDAQHERDPTPPHMPTPTPIPTPAPPFLYNASAPLSAEVQFIDAIDYSMGVNAAYGYHPIDYTNCYASFPHLGASSVLYDSEDDNWRLYGPGDQFTEEYTLVTQNQ